MEGEKPVANLTPGTFSVHSLESSDLRDRPKALDQAERVQKFLGDAHLVNVYDGVVGKKFECRRCFRRMPEGQFLQLRGVAFYRVRKPLTALHPHCHSCRKQARGRWVKHSLYSPELDRFWRAYVPSINAGARARQIFMGVDSDDLLGKYLEQDGRCALTGITMEPFKTSGRLKGGKHVAAPSVDRIDSNKHYTPDNIQIVMWAVNMMKMDLPQDVFIEICHQVSIKSMI